MQVFDVVQPCNIPMNKILYYKGQYIFKNMFGFIMCYRLLKLVNNPKFLFFNAFICIKKAFLD